MAVGQPTTGIGGLYYIILMVGILINEILKKILTFLNRSVSKVAIKMMKQSLPLFALVIGIILILYMNITGFRFVIFSGIGNAIVPSNNLWITGLFAVSIFFLILLLFYRKAKNSTIS